MRRRDFFAVAAAGTALQASPFAFAQSPPSVWGDIELVSGLPPLPGDLVNRASEPPASYSPVAPVGTAPPLMAEKQAAFDILKMSPYDTSPVEVAQYFLAVGAGGYGEALRPYSREWPVRANPAIYHFFSSTVTTPAGDTTAWCAAFMNWCLLRSRAKTADEIGKSRGDYSISGKAFSDQDIQKHTTRSASSGSFRCWDQASNPKRGDIVVFRDSGTDHLTAECRGTGHVAFYLGVPKEGWVRVLGGNQIQVGSNGAVTVADMKSGAGSRFMKIVSLR
jgi:CHAP domain